MSAIRDLHLYVAWLAEHQRSEDSITVAISPAWARRCLGLRKNTDLFYGAHRLNCIGSKRLRNERGRYTPWSGTISTL
jgi:hypothetical protein